MRYVICCVAWSTLSLATALLPIDAYAQSSAHASTAHAPNEKPLDDVKSVKVVKTMKKAVKKLVAKGARLRQTSKVVVKTAALQQDLIALKETIKALCARETNRAQAPPEE